ncbi:MAG: DUF1653 domain-containing protein [Lachnospiraceae bacterium]|nr:DUF1653 domain-containing protein [Lachnospiraceae bacterium]
MYDNTRPEPRPGEKYKHFKNKLYQILTVAIHSETREKLVIYQALYGDFATYARPLDMFMSEVDHVKYPEVKQKYRFERIDLSDTMSQNATNSNGGISTKTEMPKRVESNTMTLDNTKDAVSRNMDSDSETVNPLLMRFLDTDSFKEKYEILKTASGNIDDQLIDSIAASMDVVIEEGPLSKRFDELKTCVRTRERFETDRFRG